MLGDKVTVIVDVGGGLTRETIVEARKAGRKVTVDVGPRKTVVTEVTRGDKPIRTLTVMSSRVVSLDEEPREIEKEPGVGEKLAAALRHESREQAQLPEIDLEAMHS